MAAALAAVTALPAAWRVHAQEGPPDAPRYELTLEDALALARSSAPALRVAAARAEEALGGVAEASPRWRSNPEVDLGGGPRFGPSGTNLDLDVGLGQRFELGGQRSARLEAAAAGVETAAAQVGAREREVFGEVAAAFLGARYAEERLRVAAAAEELTAELHRVTALRETAGDIGALDVHLAAVALASARAETAQAEAALSVSFGALRALLGLPPNAQLTLLGPLAGPGRLERATLRSRLAERADLRALEAARRHAEAEAALGEALDAVDLGLRIGYAREEDANLLLAGLTVTVPVFDYGEGLEVASRARATTLALEREALEQAALAELEALLDAHERLVAGVEAFERDALPALEEAERLSRRAYEAGALSLPQLLAALRELTQARVTHVDLLYRAGLAGIELATAAGVLP